MILADTRHKLTRNDAQLAIRLIAAESGRDVADVESQLADEGIDALLDDANLANALLRQPNGAQASLPLFAYVMIRRALRRAGEDNRLLADYLTALMVGFGSRDRAHRIAETDDEVYDAVVELCEDLDDPDARRRFLVSAHLGNYALWLSGVFPDHIEYRRWHRGGPDLDYYEEMGRRGFELAAGNRVAEQQGLSPLYRAAADRFGVMRTALTSVSDALLFPAVYTPERLMRQVRDEARWRSP
jgi:hypothetical protein